MLHLNKEKNKRFCSRRLIFIVSAIIFCAILCVLLSRDPTIQISALSASKISLETDLEIDRKRGTIVT